MAPERGALQLHPSRVLRFLGNEWPDPSLGVSVWSDSILQRFTTPSTRWR